MPGIASQRVPSEARLGFKVPDGWSGVCKQLVGEQAAAERRLLRALTDRIVTCVWKARGSKCATKWYAPLKLSRWICLV